MAPAADSINRMAPQAPSPNSWCALWSRSCAISGRRKIRVFFERTWYFVVISMLVEGFCRAFQKVWTDILWKGCQLLPPCCGGVWHHQKSAPFSGPNFLWDRFWNFLLVADFLCDRFRYIFVYQIIFETDPKTFFDTELFRDWFKKFLWESRKTRFQARFWHFFRNFFLQYLKNEKAQGELEVLRPGSRGTGKSGSGHHNQHENENGLVAIRRNWQWLWGDRSQSHLTSESFVWSAAE